MIKDEKKVNLPKLSNDKKSIHRSVSNNEGDDKSTKPPSGLSKSKEKAIKMFIIKDKTPSSVNPKPGTSKEKENNPKPDSQGLELAGNSIVIRFYHLLRK